MAKSTKTLTSGEKGKSGTTISSGVISGEEYNPNLVGQNAIREYEKMRRSDATVRAALRAVKQPILSANFTVDPAEEDEDHKVADFVEHCLKEEVDWKKTLGEILTYLDFGYCVFEKIFEPGDYDGQRRIMLTSLAYRKQSTIQRWETEDGQDGITQMADAKMLSIPLEKIVRFTNEQEGDNYEGISLLRTSYMNWSIKSKLYKIDAVGHEKHALGVLDITYPSGTPDKDIKAARRAARNMRANEQSYIDHTEGIVFEFLDMKANTLRDIKPSIDHHDRQIMKNVLAQFLELGGTGGGSGSRATSEDHSRLFEQAVQSVAEHIVKVIQDYVIKQLVDLNFDVKEYPTLRVDKISDENVPILSEAIGKFVTAGVLHPRPADENSVRRIIGLAEIEDEDELNALYDTETPKDDSEDADDKITPLKAAQALHASLESELYGNARAA